MFYGFTTDRCKRNRTIVFSQVLIGSILMQSKDVSHPSISKNSTRWDRLIIDKGQDYTAVSSRTRGEGSSGPVDFLGLSLESSLKTPETVTVNISISGYELSSLGILSNLTFLKTEEKQLLRQLALLLSEKISSLFTLRGGMPIDSLRVDSLCKRSPLRSVDLTLSCFMPATGQTMAGADNVPNLSCVRAFVCYTKQLTRYFEEVYE